VAELAVTDTQDRRNMRTPEATEMWPELPLERWQDTYATLHLWTQIVGKVRLAQAPMQNHWWQVTLYLTPRGLTTSAMPHGGRTFQIDFDFLAHELQIRSSDGASRAIPLQPCSVAAFYRTFMAALRALDLEVRIWTMPQEVEEAIPFDQDEKHSSYDPEQAQRCWRVLLQADRVLQRFRSDFIGKCSPVHFFWGAFDLAVTRFSGRSAPPHPGGVPNMADWVTREAYSHEVSSAGFWPGGGAMPEAAFYAYAYPEPDGFRDYTVKPEAAYYSEDLREFILPYDAVRRAADPDRLLLDFLHSSYVAAAEVGAWDRANLERETPRSR
jgi:hypothetical protein